TCGAVAGRGAPAPVKRDSENAVSLEVAAAHSDGAAHAAHGRIQADAWGDGVSRRGRVVETQYGRVPAVDPRRHDAGARVHIRDGERTVAEAANSIGFAVHGDVVVTDGRGDAAVRREAAAADRGTAAHGARARTQADGRIGACVRRLPRGCASRRGGRV